MNFKIGENSIVYLGDNFKEWFGGMPVKGGIKLVSKKLPRSMTDKEILDELKPEEVSLGDVYHILKTLNYDIWAIFYVKDKDNVLRAVRVYWRGGGWHVRAYPTGNTIEWRDGDQVFSRNFDSKSFESSDPLKLVGKY